VAARTIKALEPEGWRGGVEEKMSDISKIQSEMMTLAQTLASQAMK